jgi:hypothetical protein
MGGGALGSRYGREAVCLGPFRPRESARLKPSSIVAAENGGDMRTRRALFFSALFSLSTAFAAALSAAGALEVTYYYLPG